ncbi:MAG: hypothetical protein JKP92_00835 [Alphaproteobacteria bacterium]|jgi:hypothetical protein|nr:hypothetical protein [Alphaproteobacteria bacterium]
MIDLERSLQSVGKKCFVEHFELFTDQTISKTDAIERLMRLDNICESSANTKVYCAGRIIKEGCANEALTNIVDSVKVPLSWREKAKALLVV